MDQAALAANSFQWFFIGLTTGIAGGMIFSALLHWITGSHH